MAILRLEDWVKYPNAIIHTKTKNKSFIRLAQLYKEMGVMNHAFPLALHNPDLEDVDPFDENITPEQMKAIAIEVSENPWYFFRECLRIPGSGGLHGIPFMANRANIGYIWCCFNHLTTMVILPRQTGKSVASDCINIFMLIAGGVNLKIMLLTKSNDLRVANINRIKAIMDLLPWYLDPRTKTDANNMETITVNVYKNRLDTAVGQTTESGAMNVGRGLTSPILNSDETAFTAGIDIILNAAIPATGTARELAAAQGAPYYNTYTTTPGYLHTKEGKYVKNNIYDACARWSDTYLDLSDEDLHTVVEKSSRSGRFWVLIEYNHRQLGKTDEWLRKKILELPTATEDSIKAEFLNIWSNGSMSSPIPKEYSQGLHNSKMEPRYLDISKDGYVTKWYIPEREVKNDLGGRKVVVGMDTSEMVGRDGTNICGRDATTGEVIVTGTYNDTNTITLSNHIADMLVRYPNMTLIPETKSTGVSMVDNIALILTAKGIDPFTRIYNIVMNDYKEKKEYEEVYRANYRRADYYTEYRKEFGYRTAGTGRAARDNLYGVTFQASIKYCHDTVRDADTVVQLQSLITKNGRIDHPEGGHDDAVIAYLLPYWFLTQAKNLHVYGIDNTKVLTVMKLKNMDEAGGPVAEYQKDKNNRLKEDLEVLLGKLKRTLDKGLRLQIISRIKVIYNYLESNGETMAVNLEDLLKQIDNESRIKKYSNSKQMM